MRKTFRHTFVWVSFLCGLTVLMTLFPSSTTAIQARCVQCESLTCEYIYRDGKANCLQYPWGCTATGSCTITRLLTR